MTGQMLAGEVGLQLRITYGGKQLGHRAPKPPVRQKEIRHLKNKVRDAFLSQIVGAERLGNLPSDAPHLHFELFLLHIPACNAEGGAIAEAVILAENHPCIRHAQNACGAGHIIENIAAVPLLSGVMDNEDANAVVIGELFQAGQILVVLGIGIDLCGSIVPHHLEGIDEYQARGGKCPQSLLDLPLQLRAQLPAGKAKAEILRRRIRQLLHTLLNAPFPVLQGQIYHIGFSGGQSPHHLAAADLQAQPQHHPALADLGVTR